MASEREGLEDLIRLKVREHDLANNLFEATHLFYCVLLWIAKQPESDFRLSTLKFIRAKFHHMPQASRLGQIFVDIEKQFGNPLESNSVDLERWVFESRGRWNE